MILCDDWGIDPNNPRRINIFGLLSTIRALDPEAARADSHGQVEVTCDR
jgi:hypothetical protein